MAGTMGLITGENMMVKDVTSRMEDPDLAQLFRNAFPITVDTTIRWHTNGSNTNISSSRKPKKDGTPWQGPQTFIDKNDPWQDKLLFGSHVSKSLNASVLATISSGRNLALFEL